MRTGSKNKFLSLIIQNARLAEISDAVDIHNKGL
jgi:hypothetical protein